MEGGPTQSNKAVVVGIYGIPGSGKTFLLNELKLVLPKEHFSFYEGSQTIADLVPGGLIGFQKLEEQEKIGWRQLAIETIRKECSQDGRVAVVAAHFMFWPEDEEAGRLVYTQNDLDIFTHVLYLNIPDEVIFQRRLGDRNKNRPSVSISHLGKWKHIEERKLRDLCRSHDILFLGLCSQHGLLEKVSTLLHDFHQHNEGYNMSLAKMKLDNIVSAGNGKLKTVLVMDADRTLSAVDTGVLFWQKISGLLWANKGESPLDALFGSRMGYSYTAFRQATLLYEEVTDSQRFNAMCKDVASDVVMYPAFVSLLHQVAKEDHVAAVVVTCGLRRVWEIALENEGLSEIVKVIGGGRIADGYVVTAEVKAAMVSRLQDTYQTCVWAFGDSPLDLPMLSQANQAIVVVGSEKTRSKTMDLDLFNVIRDGGLRARQVVFPTEALPRFDTNILPLVCLTDEEFISSIICHKSRPAGIEIQHATHRNASKLLMTPMRDAHVVGPALRESHRRVGQYLATEFLSQIIGIEGFTIPHVQGHNTNGFRLLHEQKTTIVALMRGGEPMAFGVNDIFPLAMFVHASCPEDIKLNHLQDQLTVVLVDSVVNNGTTVVQFEKHIRKLHVNIRVVVVAGVIQEESISEHGLIYGVDRTTKLALIALRLSQNKFTGRGSTDTGNRLFNTTHLS